jgi:metallo-beta-lactamase family protein
MQITAYGSAGEVTGSNIHLVTDSGTNCLIDFGLFQGSPSIEAANRLPLGFDPSEIDFVVLTHAHIDHSGRLPVLVKHGFQGPIYMTYPTRDLVEALLLDSAEIQLEESDPLYDAEDVWQTLALTYPLGYNDPIDHGEIELSFHQSGHLLGSAFVKLKADGKTITFSGDVGRYRNQYYPDPAPIGPTDVLISESTYGNSNHRKKVDAFNELLETVLDKFKQGRTIIIPAFSVGRTTEILHGLRQLADQTGRLNELDRIPVYLDSPLGIRALEIYLQRRDYLAAAFHEKYLSGPNVHLLQDPGESHALDNKTHPKLIISSGGMAQGGHILHHLEAFLPQENTSIIFVGYQAEETIGRAILEGRDVVIADRQIEVKAEIIPISGFSGHGDQSDLSEWIATSTVKQILLSHGEPDVIHDWQNHLIDQGYQVNILHKGVPVTV